MEDWLIELEGQEKDLRLLSELLNSRDLKVSEDKGVFTLRSSRFVPVPNPIDILEMSNSLVDILNGAAKLYNEGFQGVTAKAVVRVHEDGRTSKYQGLTAAPRSLRLRALPSRLDLLESWFTIAEGNECIARALTLYGSLQHNWRTLYMVLEVIEDDLGGQACLSEKGWVPKKKLKQFKRTANSYLAIGREARHGAISTQPPKTPMSLQDAKWLMHDLLWRWLDSKEQGPP